MRPSDCPLPRLFDGGVSFMASTAPPPPQRTAENCAFSACRARADLCNRLEAGVTWRSKLRCWGLLTDPLECFCLRVCTCSQAPDSHAAGHAQADQYSRVRWALSAGSARQTSCARPRGGRAPRELFGNEWLHVCSRRGVQEQQPRRPRSCPAQPCATGVSRERVDATQPLWSEPQRPHHALRVSGLCTHGIQYNV